MKVKNLEAWEAKAALAELLTQPLPIKVAYALAKLARQLNEQHALIDQVRTKAITEYGTPNERGQIEMRQDNPRWSEFAAAFNDLMGEEVEIGGEHKIAVPVSDGIVISAASLMALEPFVEVA